MSYRSGRAKSGQASIFYEEAGSGRAVVFCHAGVADRRMWDPQFEKPLAGHRYIRSDMRGYGKSEWIAEPFSITTDIEAVIDELALDGFVVVGCSMGGRAAMEIAVRMPERAVGLIVIGSGTPDWEPPGGGYQPPQYEGSEKLFEAGKWDEVVRIDADVWGVGMGRSWDEVDQGLLEKIMEMDMTPVQTEYQRDEHQRWSEGDMQRRLEEIQVPALVVVGENDLPGVLAGAQDLADRIADGQRIVIEDSAHLPSMERPEVFNPILAGFLGSI